MNIWDEKFYGGTEHLQKKYQIPEENFGDFIKLLKTIKTKRVLDLGCGTGRHTIPLAENGFEAYGIDISKNALKVCRDRLKESNTVVPLLGAEKVFLIIGLPIANLKDFLETSKLSRF